jgi:hypothetical protein
MHKEAGRISAINLQSPITNTEEKDTPEQQRLLNVRAESKEANSRGCRKSDEVKQ